MHLLKRHKILALSASLMIVQVGLLPPARAAMKCSELTFEIDPATARYPEITVSKLKNAGFKGSQTKDDFSLFLKGMFQNLENTYGPLVNKGPLLHFDWETMKAEALGKAKTLETSNDQYFFISEFLAKFNDAHISVELPSSLTNSLPLQISYSASERRFFVWQVDGNFPKGRRSPNLGDELIEINGLSPVEVQKQLSLFNTAGNPLTNRIMFSMMISRLREARGFPLSKMKSHTVHLKFQTPKGEVYDLDLNYHREGLGLVGKDLDGVGRSPKIVSAPTQSKAKANLENLQYAGAGTHSILVKVNKMMNTMASFEEFMPETDAKSGGKKDKNEKGSKIQLGAQEPYFKLPKDFKEISPPTSIAGFMPGLNFKKFFNGNHFFAGTFVRDGKTVGFLRIPSYEPTNVATMLHSIRYYISKLQAQSDYLVIDQTRNPGGMVVFSDLIVKSLVGKLNPNRHLQFKVKPFEGFLREYLETKAEIVANRDKIFTPKEVKYFKDKLDAEFEKIYSAQQSGAALSEPISMIPISEYMEIALNRLFIKSLSAVDKDEPKMVYPKLTPEAKDSIDKLEDYYKTLTGAPGFSKDQGQRLREVSNFMAFLNFEKLDGANIFKNVQYTKPVYFLIDPLDFSGGDATPASLQDYGRARLIGVGGKHTAGAGGTVEEFPIRGLLNFNARWTTSLMVRLKKHFVENYGVEAEVDVPVTRDDIIDGFKNVLERAMQMGVDPYLEKDLQDHPSSAATQDLKELIQNLFSRGQ